MTDTNTDAIADMLIGIDEPGPRKTVHRSIKPGPIQGVMFTLGSKQPALVVTLELKSLRD